jgi:uncharacterized cupin superfamily protein
MTTPSLQSIRIERPSPELLAKLGVYHWPLWEKGISEFPWHYEDLEVCYLLEGRAEISSSDGLVEVGEGDLVSFPKGLRCTWKVKSPVRKHYHFGQL